MKSVIFNGERYYKIISASQIKRRVKELASEIKKDYTNKQPLFICMLNGAALFTSDLMRAIDTDAYIEFVACKSYTGITRGEKLNFTTPLTADVKDRDIIIIEDLIDSGHTMYETKRLVMERGAASCRIVVLINKPGNIKYDVMADYIGFNISKGFIVGNGFDVDGYGRGLKDIYQKKR